MQRKYVGAYCDRGNVGSKEGRRQCEKVCEHHFCCFDASSGGRDCSGDESMACHAYEACSNLFVVSLEKLGDPAYASAVERLFGVPGVTETRSAFCERPSHKANRLVPLQIENATLGGETEAEHEETLSLMERVQFDQAF